MKRKIIISLVILAVVSVSVYWVWGRGEKKQEYITAIAQKRELIQTVSEAGVIKSPRQVSLSFSTSGKLAQKHVEVGDVVEKGDVLAELDHGKLDKEKEKAQSDLEVARAGLAQTVTGAKQETIEVSQAQVSQAKESYEAALRDLKNVKETTAEDIQQAEERLNDLTSSGADNITSYEQAVKDAEIALENVKKEYEQNINDQKEASLVVTSAKLPTANSALDQVDVILNDDDLQGIFSVQSSKYKRYTENNYDDSLKLKEVAVSSLDEATTNDSKNNILEALSKNIEYLERVATTLEYCYSGLENTITTGNFSQTELTSYKTKIDTQITAVYTAIDSLKSSKRTLNSVYLSYETNLSSAESQLNQARTNLDEAIRNARNALSTARLRGEQNITSAEAKVVNAKESWEVARRRFEEIRSGATREDINLAQAKVSQAEAAVKIVEERINDSIVKSPINGKVVNFEYEVGEQVAAGSPVVSVLGNNDYEIEVDISEADIAKVEEGDVAEITLDAFGEDEKFTGKVFFIDPDQTVIQDVVYYKVKLKFIEAGEDRLERMKPGMTANISITTEEKNDILVIPGRAVIEKEDSRGEMQKYVRVLQGDGSVTERQVRVGLRGDGGLTEITEGLKEGEEVVTYVKE
jgi:HlyD family secretion protein